MDATNENRDALTKLWSAKWAYGMLDNIIRHNGQVALILIDIDRMYAFNHMHGHNKGDREIVRISREIEAHCPESSLAFRLGGDEFGVILYEASIETARQTAETIRANRRSIHFTMPDGNESIALSLSLGIAQIPYHAFNAESLIWAADLALLKAKRGGRLPDGRAYVGRNRVMAIGDFFDEFPQQSAKFIRR